MNESQLTSNAGCWRFLFSTTQLAPSRFGPLSQSRPNKLNLSYIFYWVNFWFCGVHKKRTVTKKVYIPDSGIKSNGAGRSTEGCGSSNGAGRWTEACGSSNGAGWSTCWHSARRSTWRSGNPFSCNGFPLWFSSDPCFWGSYGAGMSLSQPTSFFDSSSLWKAIFWGLPLLLASCFSHVFFLDIPTSKKNLCWGSMLRCLRTGTLIPKLEIFPPDFPR